MGITLEIKASIAQAAREISSLTARLDEVKKAAEAARLKGDLIGAEKLAAEGREIERNIARLERLRDAAKLDYARGLLDVRPWRDIQREIDQAKMAFERLKASGKPSNAELGQAFAHLQGRIVELKSQTNGWAEAFDKIKGSAAAALGAFAGVFASVKVAASFESSMVDLARATGQTKEEAAGLADEFRRLAETYGISAEAVAGIATVGGKMGIAREELSRFVQTVAQAAINFDMVPEEAAKALATLSAVLKVPVKDLDAFAGAINAVSDAVGVMERDVIDALTRAGASAQALGLTREQAAAMAAAMIRLGATSEVAGSAIRTFSTRLRGAIGDSGEAGAALGRVVGDVRAFAELLYTDGQAAVSQFFSALNKMPAPERFAALKAIFQEGLDTETITKLAEGVDTYAKALGAASGDAESFRRQLAELTAMKLDSAEAGFRSLKEAIRNLAAALGENLLPVIKPITWALNAIASGLRAIAQHAPILSTLAVLAGAIAIAFAPLRVLFGGLVMLLSRIGVSAAGLTAVAALGARIAPVFARAIPIVGGVALAIDAIRFAIDKLSGSGNADAAAERVRKIAEDWQETSARIRGALDDVANVISDRLTAATRRFSDGVKALGEDYKSAEGQIRESLTRQLAAIDDAGKRRVEAAKRAAQGETQEAVAATQAVIAAEREKLAAVDAAATQMLDAWNRTYGAAIDAARAAGQNVVDVENQALQAKIAIYSQIEQSYRATIDRLIGEEQRHLDAVRRIEEERAQLKMSVEDRIRALQQQGMSEIDAYADRWRQVNEKQAAAQAALAAGHFEQAKQMAEQAMRLAESNAHAVSVNSQEVVSKQQAIAQAVREVAESARIMDQALAGMEASRADMANKAASALDKAKMELAEITAQLDALRSKQAAAIEVKIDADASGIRAVAEEIRNLTAAAQEVKAAKDALAALSSEIEKIKAGGAVTLDVSARIDAAESAIERVKASAGRLDIPVSADLSQAMAGLEKLRGDLAVPSTHLIVVNDAAARAAIDQLKQPTSSTHTIYVNKVYTNAQGGLIQKLAEGGRAIAHGFRRMTGRIVGPGTETSDSIPALLSHGEYVIRAASVRKFGAAFFDALNAGFLPPMPRYATGGIVPAIHATSDAPSRDVVDLRFHVGGKSHTVQSSRETAMQLAKALRELSRGA